MLCSATAGSVPSLGRSLSQGSHVAVGVLPDPTEPSNTPPRNAASDWRHWARRDRGADVWGELYLTARSACGSGGAEGQGENGNRLTPDRGRRPQLPRASQTTDLAKLVTCQWGVSHFSPRSAPRDHRAAGNTAPAGPRRRGAPRCCSPRWLPAPCSPPQRFALRQRGSFFTPVRAGD